MYTSSSVSLNKCIQWNMYNGTSIYDVTNKMIKINSHE